MCQRLNDVKSAKLKLDNSPEAIPEYPITDPLLRAMIRGMIRKLQSLTFSARQFPADTPRTNLRDVVKAEFAAMIGNAYTDPHVYKPPLTYVQVAAVSPAIAT